MLHGSQVIAYKEMEQ